MKTTGEKMISPIAGGGVSRGSGAVCTVLAVTLETVEQIANTRGRMTRLGLWNLIIGCDCELL